MENYLYLQIICFNMNNYTGKDIKKTIQDIQEWINHLPNRKDECEKESHQDPTYSPYFIDNRSSHSDTVDGRCGYCLSSLTRRLTDEEHGEINRFYKSLHEPMTI